MKSRRFLNRKKLHALKEDSLFWILHTALDLGSTLPSLKGVEMLGKSVARLKTSRDRHILKIVHTLKYAHQLDLFDLKNRVQMLDRDFQDLHECLRDFKSDLKSDLKDN